MCLMSWAALAFSHGQPTYSDDVLNVSGMAPGNYPANNFSGFTTPATTVFSSGGTNYLSPNPDNAVMLAVSQHSVRDSQITTWTHRGALYLRMANGSALYFYNNGDANSGAGLVEIGIVQNFVPTTGNDFGGTGTFYAYYINSNPVGTLAGYSTTYSPGDSFTFGTRGFNVFLEINGVQVFSYTEWRCVQYGLDEVWTHSGDGVTNIDVHYLPNQFLYSSPSANIYDPRDFGMRAIAPVTGSMAQGSPTLTLANNVGFQVGDQIIVELGGEAGAGAQNTVGVGGVTPNFSYATVAAMNADTSQADGTLAYVATSGAVYQSESGVWTAYSLGGSYYVGVKNPLALVAVVNAVSADGLTLTLSKNAATATTNANVWLDCLPSFFVLNEPQSPTLGSLPPAPSGVSISIPAGTWAMSAPVVNNTNITLPVNLTVYGAGRTKTTLFSPKGAQSAFLNLNPAQNGTVARDFKWIGNHGYSGYMFTLTPSGQFSGTYPIVVELLAAPGTTGLELKNIDLVNDFGQGLIIQGGSGMLIDNSTTTMQQGQEAYLGWQFDVEDCSGGTNTISNSTATGAYLMKSFEMFACNTGVITNSGGQNALYSTNSSTSWTIDMTGTLDTITAGAFFSTNSGDQDEAIINVNDNAFGSGSTGLINNPNIIQSGYIDANNDSLKFIQIVAQQTNVTVQGQYPGSGGCSTTLGGLMQASDYNAASVEYGAMAVYSDAPDTIVSGIRVKGAAISSPGHSSHYGNISATGSSSSVTNNVADVIQPGPTISGNQTNAAYGGC